MNFLYLNKKKLPTEIIDIILEYHFSYIHKLKFINVLKNIPLHYVFLKIIYITKIYQIDRNYSDEFYDLIMELTSYDERINMIKILNTCNCCSRHKKNKPSIDDFLNGFVPDYKVKYQNIHQCVCKCRSFIRDLCRAQNDEIVEI